MQNAPPKHRIDATLQAMERAHRTTTEEQVIQFSQSVRDAQRAFEVFSQTDDAQAPPPTGHSLLALVEAENQAGQAFDHALETVKENLAQMERKRMLALGAMVRLQPEEALEEVKRLKEQALSLALRVPLRADFIVHGHNIGLSIFRLFEAAEKAQAEVQALINAKAALDSDES